MEELLGRFLQILVVLAFASPILFKRLFEAGKKQGHPQKPLNRMPTFGGGDPMRPKRPAASRSGRGFAQAARRDVRSDESSMANTMPEAARTEPASRSGEGVGRSEEGSGADWSDSRQLSRFREGLGRSEEGNSDWGRARRGQESRRETLSPSPVEAAAMRTDQDAFRLNGAREEVIRGVIWSEVLGPPRAKKPFRR